MQKVVKNQVFTADKICTSFNVFRFFGGNGQVYRTVKSKSFHLHGLLKGLGTCHLVPIISISEYHLQKVAFALVSLASKKVDISPALPYSKGLQKRRIKI